MVYSTSVLWDMLDNNDRKILGHFIWAYNLLVVRFVTEDNLKEVQERLKDMAYFIEHVYGSKFITSNIISYILYSWLLSWLWIYI